MNAEYLSALSDARQPAVRPVDAGSCRSLRSGTCAVAMFPVFLVPYLLVKCLSLYFIFIYFVRNTKLIFEWFLKIFYFYFRGKTDRSSFVSFASLLTDVIVCVHEKVLLCLHQEQYASVLIHLLKCIDTLAINSPYEKLRTNFSDKLTEAVFPFLSHRGKISGSVLKWKS